MDRDEQAQREAAGRALFEASRDLRIIRRWVSFMGFVLALELMGAALYLFMLWRASLGLL